MAITSTYWIPEKMPCTAYLVSFADPLYDPSVSIIKKIAIAILSFFVIPVGISFALVGDFAYAGYTVVWPKQPVKQPPPPSTQTPPSQVAKDPQAKDPQAKDPQAKDPQAKDPQAKDPQAKDPQAKDPQVEDPQAKDPQVEDPQAKDPQVEMIQKTVGGAVEKIETPIEEKQKEEPTSFSRTIGKVALAASLIGIGVYLYVHFSKTPNLEQTISQVVDAANQTIGQATREVIPDITKRVLSDWNPYLLAASGTICQAAVEAASTVATNASLSETVNQTTEVVKEVIYTTGHFARNTMMGAVASLVFALFASRLFGENRTVAPSNAPTETAPPPQYSLVPPIAINNGISPATSPLLSSRVLPYSPQKQLSTKTSPPLSLVNSDNLSARFPEASSALIASGPNTRTRSPSPIIMSSSLALSAPRVVYDANSYTNSILPFEGEYQLENLSTFRVDRDANKKEEKYVRSLYMINHLPDLEKRGLILLNLQSYIDTPTNAFIKCAQNAKDAIIAMDPSQNPAEICEIYQTFIQKSRAALQAAKEISTNIPELLQEAINFLKWAHHIKYTTVSMYPFYKKFIGRALAESRNNFEMPLHLSRLNIATTIHLANHSLARGFLEEKFLQNYGIMQLNKLLGTIGAYFDPSAGSNTPWVHSLQTVANPQGNEKTITVLRHGTPTIDPTLPLAIFRETRNLLQNLLTRATLESLPDHRRLATVTPEYEAYLEAYPSKQTLYINHQKYPKNKTSNIHGEEARSLVLQDLETTHTNFHFASFPLDGPIWDQTWLGKVSNEDLKNRLFNSLINGADGFALPKSIDATDPVFQRKIRTILDQVLELYFENGRTSQQSLKQKKAFVMIFFSYVKNLLKSKFDIDFIVSACKDNKDRGNASTLVDMIITMMLLGQEDNHARLEELFFSALGPFIIKNEEIIEERLELALAVIERIAALNVPEKNAIREAFQGMTGLQIIAQSVPGADIIGSDTSTDNFSA